MGIIGVAITGLFIWLLFAPRKKEAVSVPKSSIQNQFEVTAIKEGIWVASRLEDEYLLVCNGNEKIWVNPDYIEEDYLESGL